MNADLPFTPIYESAQSVSTSASVAVISVPKGSKALCVTNTGSVHITIRVGLTDAIQNEGYLLLAGSQVIIAKPANESRLTAISTSESMLHVVAGRGI